MENEAVMNKRPLDYLRIAFRRKWFIIIPTVIGLSGGIIALNILPKIYQSSTLMLVEEGRVVNPLIRGLTVSTSIAERLNVLREQMLGWDRINQLISTLDLAGEVKSQIEFEALVKKLRKNIRVDLYGSNIVRISHEGRDPKKAMNIVKTITDIFIAENLKQQNSETENAISFINDQLVLYQRQLKESEIATMEDKLTSLLLDSTDKHPMVIEYKQKIESARAELKSGNYRVSAESATSTDTNVAQLKQELKDLREEISTSSLDASRGGENRVKHATNTNEKLYKLLLIDKADRVTSDDTSVNSKLYDQLLQRLETAKITQRLEASQEGTKYIILDPARLPLLPIKPNKPMVLLAGMFIGACVGIGFVFLMEILDHSFLGTEDAEAYLKKPILATIPKIITQSDMRQERIRSLKVASASILTAVILVFVIIFNVIRSS
ncbi:MAG: GNVR domain-containing protein [Candidatus Omnitrophota bacterium]